MQCSAPFYEILCSFPDRTFSQKDRQRSKNQNLHEMNVCCKPQIHSFEQRMKTVNSKQTRYVADFLTVDCSFSMHILQFLQYTILESFINSYYIYLIATWKK